jgi:hypothetical protein
VDLGGEDEETVGIGAGDQSDFAQHQLLSFVFGDGGRETLIR